MVYSIRGFDLAALDVEVEPIAATPASRGRLVFGARISLSVGLIAPVLGLIVGGGLGMLAGYFRGRFETLVVGSIDVLLAFPPLVLALAITTYLGHSG